MENEEDQNKLDASLATGSEAAESTALDIENYGRSGVDFQPRNSECKQGVVNDGGLGSERQCEANIVYENEAHSDAESVDMNMSSGSEIGAQKHLASDYDSVCDKSVSRDAMVDAKRVGAERDDCCGALDVNFGQRVKFELTGTTEIYEKSNRSACEGQTGDGGLTVGEAIPVRSHGSLSGVKRARLSVDEDQPSVHITYNNLRRASKEKLEELLQQWSQWEAKCGATQIDLADMLVSGNETFFPALNVGSKKGSAVSFCLDDHSMSQQNQKFIPLDSNSAPLYDRGYALGLTLVDGSSNSEGDLKIVDDASRCFNCGSYNHSLRECPKPRDNMAISNARNQHMSRRNQNPNSHNSARYYQNSPCGKFDGLSPGALDAETRKVLGLGELDPPPWLSRMREIGYPPGYLALEDKNESSGITIYADEEIAVEKEEGKMIETKHQSEAKRNMMVEFPGINVKIPKNADERLWAATPLSLHPHRSWPPQRLHSFSDDIGRSHHRDQGCFVDFRFDGSPGNPYYCSSISRFNPPNSIYLSSYHASEYASPTLARYQFGGSRWSAFR